MSSEKHCLAALLEYVVGDALSRSLVSDGGWTWHSTIWPANRRPANCKPIQSHDIIFFWTPEHFLELHRDTKSILQSLHTLPISDFLDNGPIKFPV